MAVNLIPRQVKEKREKSFWKKSSLWGSVAIFVGVAAVSAGIVIFKFSLQRDIKALEDNIDSEKTRITAQKDVELKMRDLSKRAKAAGKVLENANKYSRILDKVTALMPVRVSLSKMSMREAEQAQISGTARSYVDLARFIYAVQQDEELLTGLQLRSVNLDTQTGNVNFDLEVTVSKEALRGAR
ncbi:MAG: PilN domain-containing protein [Patescibacteria group bacterium]|nr:PilN domain-containing protein [Patescibacteria group bacterium]